MTSKKIYIVRHGQTDFNLKGIVQGSGVDSSLNNLGRLQAQAFHEQYKNIPFDKIYTSALRRTVETMKPFIDMGIPYESLAGLNEISWGNKEGQTITVDEDAYYHWMLKQWQEGRTDLKIDGGESPQEVAARQQGAIQHILQKTDEETVLVCMHGRAIRILLCNLLHYPLHSMDSFEHQNLCLYLLHYSGSLFRIDKHNDVSHLDRLPGLLARDAGSSLSLESQPAGN